jgi:AcrR family transcriptional regulator
MDVMQSKRTKKAAGRGAATRSVKGDRSKSSGPAIGATANVSDRFSRARMRTRQKLIDAAHRIIGRKGVEATTINDITEEADVGLGSFYNHFASKEELVRVVFADRVEELGKIFDNISSTVSDPALAVSYIQKMFLEKVRTDTAWGWFAVHAEIALQQMDIAFSERARKDLQRGVDQGRFTIESVDIAVRLIMATLLVLTRAILESRLDPEVIVRSTELQLRMLGVSVEDARAIVCRPLPDFAQAFLRG